jgi:hypothetical protein
MKRLFILLVILGTSQLYSQELWDAMNLPKVIINKKYTSYTIAYATVENGIKKNIEYNSPNINNPVTNQSQI